MDSGRQISQWCTMLALRCQASLGQLSLEEVERPAVSQADQVLVRVGYAGLCGTDLHIMSVSTPFLAARVRNLPRRASSRWWGRKR